MTPPHVPTLLVAAGIILAVVVLYHCTLGRRKT